ncbi:MAG: Crp/Fnr family transcriptional regulator [Bacteroidales bacterium]|nr:Crp/Fnr family transcriptional regulator [Bacteroidales bacterium]MBP5724104.1 Crp/Fnr family transcriptional regulator [Bacteroidales bacterium]MBQ3676127.1 Crp/Fnr family transcriptional regulator [Bacteroidales bacterium]
MKVPSYNEMVAELKKTNIAKTLSEKEVNEILSNLKFIPYKKGETIFKQGHSINETTILMRGLTKTSVENRSHDRSTIISLQVPVSIVGVSTLFDETYPATAEALNDSIIAFIEKDTIRRILGTNPKFASAMVELTSRCLNKFIRQIADLGQKQIKARMASILLIISELIDNDYIDIQISRNELAEYAGISTGSAIRLLSELEKEGYIFLDKKNIEIKNKAGLELVSQVDD